MNQRNLSSFFTPTDFAIITPGEEWRIRDTKVAADIANQLLKKYIEEQPVVYGHSMDGDDFLYSRGEKNLDTHSARLVCVKELRSVDEELEGFLEAVKTAPLKNTENI